MRRLLMLLAVAGLMAGLPLAAAEARNYYGAIAYSQATGANGYAYNAKSRAGAERRALKECAAYGAGCRIAVWFGNACGALAVGQNGWGVAWNRSAAIARSGAVAQCSAHTYGCRVLRWVCTDR